MRLVLALIACLLLTIQPVLAQDGVERRQLDKLDVPMDEGIVEPRPSAEVTGSTAKTGTIVDLTEPSGADLDPADRRGAESPAPLRIGLMAVRGVSYLRTRTAPFRTYMEDTLVRPVQIIPFSNIRLLMSAHAAHKIDYAIYPASVFAMAYASCGCLLPLVAPSSTARPEGLYMLLLVRPDSGIEALAELTGRSLVLSSSNGALPFHMALNELRLSGLDTERDLQTIERKDTPEAALDLLSKGEVDAALVWSTTRFNQSLATSPGAVAAYLASDREEAKAGGTGFRSIWRSPAIPAGPHVVHNTLSKQERADLVTALTAMNKRDPAAYDAIERYYDGGFSRVTLDDYAPLITIATATAGE